MINRLLEFCFQHRRTFIDLDMGPVIKKNMNRCIHCTRCIRFCDEVGGFREMVALKRGNSTEITTVDGKPLETEYAGTKIPICFSAGWVGYEKGETTEQFLERADRILYAEKRSAKEREKERLVAL